MLVFCFRRDVKNTFCENVPISRVHAHCADFDFFCSVLCKLMTCQNRGHSLHFSIPEPRSFQSLSPCQKPLQTFAEFARSKRVMTTEAKFHFSWVDSSLPHPDPCGSEHLTNRERSWQFGDEPFRRWWSQVFYAKKVCVFQILWRLESVAHADNFHGRVSFSGIWWPFVFVVRCLWRHNLTS